MMHSTSCGERALARFVMDHARWPVVVIDGAGVVVEMNRSARERADQLMEILDPETPDTVLDGFLSALEIPGATLEAGFSHTFADGRTRHVSLHGANLHGWRVVGVEDVTERHALELELEGLRRIDSLGMLTASLVHDLNNLLTPVLYLSSAALHAVEGTRAELQLRDLEASAQRAAALVRDMLALGRPRPAVKGAVDVNAAVSELAPIAERLLGDRIALALALEPDLPCVRLDRARLEHALLNLLANARDAMPDGGRVRITSARSRARDGAPLVAITVSDDGAGMSEAVRARAFEQWFTTKATGTGLGLSSVHSFVRANGGTVSVESALGRGTSITMRLPADEPRTTGERELAQPAATAVVLVVDPDAPVRAAARAMLEVRGLSAVEADDLEEALTVTDALTVDVALIDLSLARDARERLRVAAPEARIVWMTAEPSTVDARVPGVMLRKAFSERELLCAVRDALVAGR